jgi:hypothetical protein
VAANGRRLIIKGCRLSMNGRRPRLSGCRRCQLTDAAFAPVLAMWPKLVSELTGLDGRHYPPLMVRLRALRLAVAALMLAGGCSAAPKDPGGGPVTIEWWSGRARWGTNNDVRQVLRDAFERAHPSIKIRIVTGPDSTDRQHDALIRTLKRMFDPDL